MLVVAVIEKELEVKAAVEDELESRAEVEAADREVVADAAEELNVMDKEMSSLDAEVEEAALVA